MASVSSPGVGQRVSVGQLRGVVLGTLGTDNLIIVVEGVSGPENLVVNRRAARPVRGSQTGSIMVKPGGAVVRLGRGLPRARSRAE